MRDAQKTDKRLNRIAPVFFAFKSNAKFGARRREKKFFMKKNEKQKALRITQFQATINDIEQSEFSSHDFLGRFRKLYENEWKSMLQRYRSSANQKVNAYLSRLLSSYAKELKIQKLDACSSSTNIHAQASRVHCWKKILVCMSIIALTGLNLMAQSLNPLNYSGILYLKSTEIITTPRYVSYEDHAILHTEMRVPCTNVKKFDFDFSKGIITTEEGVVKVKVDTIKKYNTDNSGWVVVIYMTSTSNNNEKLEFVWPQSGNPFMQGIVSKSDGKKEISRAILSQKPYAKDPGAALLDILTGGAFDF